MKYAFRRGNHSVYTIQFHYVACVKYRRKVLIGAIADRLKEINKEVAESFGIGIIEQECDGDHVHILFTSKPQIAPSRFVNSMKAVSARRLFNEFPILKKRLWKGHLWSPSYFLASTGEVTLEIIKQYVANQNL
jgi:putative transposase